MTHYLLSHISVYDHWWGTNGTTCLTSIVAKKCWNNLEQFRTNSEQFRNNPEQFGTSIVAKKCCVRFVNLNE